MVGTAASAGRVSNRPPLAAPPLRPRTQGIDIRPIGTSPTGESRRPGHQGIRPSCDHLLRRDRRHPAVNLDLDRPVAEQRPHPAESCRQRTEENSARRNPD